MQGSEGGSCSQAQAISGGASVPVDSWVGLGRHGSAAAGEEGHFCGVEKGGMTFQSAASQPRRRTLRGSTAEGGCDMQLMGGDATSKRVPAGEVRMRFVISVPNPSVGRCAALMKNLHDCGKGAVPHQFHFPHLRTFPWSVVAAHDGEGLAEFGEICREDGIERFRVP